MPGATSDVVVVGGGAVGAAVTYELAAAGARVTLLERGPALASECSYGNTGMIRLSHATPIASPASVSDALRWCLSPSSPFRIHPRLTVLPWLLRFLVASRSQQVELGTRALESLCRMSLSAHRAYSDLGIDTGFAATGILDVYQTDRGYQGGLQSRDHNAHLGLASEVMSKEAARELAPTLAQNIAGAIYYPADAHCDPLRFVTSVGAAAERHGATISTNVEVRAIERSGNRITKLRTSSGDISPGQVVLAAGAWSPALAKQAGVFIPIEAGKGYHVDFARAPGDPRVPVSIKEGRIYVTPLNSGLRFGGTLELDGINARIDDRRVDGIKRTAFDVLPHTREGRVIEVWSGLRPCSPDGLPIIGPAPGIENLLLTTGHGMSGLQHSAITGRLAREILYGLPASHDLHPFRPSRFAPLTRRTWPAPKPDWIKAPTTTHAHEPFIRPPSR